MVCGMSNPPEHLQTDETRAALTAAIVNLDRLKEAVTRATARAAEAEIARANAEEKHAALVADALMEDRATPSKPATLSAVQAADDSADAACELLNRRLLASEGAVHGAAAAHLEAGMKLIIDDQVHAGTDALARMVKAAADLNAARGIGHMRNAMELISQRTWDDGLHLVAVQGLAAEVPQISQVVGMYGIRIAEAVKPITAEAVAAILKGICK